MITSLPLTLKAYPLTALFAINSECLRAFHGMFEDIPRNFWQYSTECLATFPRIFGNIPRNDWWHSPDCFRTFPGMFENIPRNIWEHSQECLATFPGMFVEILRNVWGHSPEYNVSPILRPSYNGFLIPFVVLVFLILCIAHLV